MSFSFYRLPVEPAQSAHRTKTVSSCNAQCGGCLSWRVEFVQLTSSAVVRAAQLYTHREWDHSPLQDVHFMVVSRIFFRRGGVHRRLPPPPSPPRMAHYHHPTWPMQLSQFSCGNRPHRNLQFPPPPRFVSCGIGSNAAAPQPTVNLEVAVYSDTSMKATLLSSYN